MLQVPDDIREDWQPEINCVRCLSFARFHAPVSRPSCAECYCHLARRVNESVRSQVFCGDNLAPPSHTTEARPPPSGMRCLACDWCQIGAKSACLDMAFYHTQ